MSTRHAFEYDRTETVPATRIAESALDYRKRRHRPDHEHRNPDRVAQRHEEVEQGIAVLAVHANMLNLVNDQKSDRMEVGDAGHSGEENRKGLGPITFVKIGFEAGVPKSRVDRREEEPAE